MVVLETHDTIVIGVCHLHRVIRLGNKNNDRDEQGTGPYEEHIEGPAPKLPSQLVPLAMLTDYYAMSSLTIP